jgi:hypothetical protein
MQLQINLIKSSKFGLQLLAATFLISTIPARASAQSVTTSPDVNAQLSAEANPASLERPLVNANPGADRALRPIPKPPVSKPLSQPIVKPMAPTAVPTTGSVTGSTTVSTTSSTTISTTTSASSKTVTAGSSSKDAMGKAPVGKSTAQMPTTEQAPVTPSPAGSATVTTEVSPQDVDCDCKLKLKLLTPSTDAVLDAPAGIVVISHQIGKTAELRVNGQLVNRSQIGKTETDSPKRLVTETWYGVPLRAGSNTLTATTDGETASTTVIVRGMPKKLAITTVQSRVPANGRSVIDIKGQLLDDQGNLSKQDVIVTLAATAGEFLGQDADLTQNGFQVAMKDGQFSAQLRSGVEAKSVQVRAAANGLEAFTQVAFEADLRPSVATGVVNLRLGAKGNDFYGRLRDFLPFEGGNDFVFDLSGKVFATGKVGSWLFTGGYNSQRALNQSCDDTIRLFRVNQACDNQYPTYGDNSQLDILAPSTDSVYLKFERTSPIGKGAQDYLMWGDYHTEEFANKSQQFTAMTRELHGLKGNYNFGNLQVTALYANNVKGFQRDTVAPDGTSGYYFLSRRQMIEGSENVFVEVEELNRPGTVLQRQQLIRGADYSIDYDRGTLLFTQPVLRTDIGPAGETLVRRIVTTYQYDETGPDNSLYAGRVRYHLSRERDRETWLGASYITETQGVRNFELYGADAYIGLGQNSGILAEIARSRSDSEFLGQVDGHAVRIEAFGDLSKSTTARAYYRQADSGFSNNATVSFVPGQTRYGAQISSQVGPTTTLRAQYDHELNTGIAPQPIATVADLFAAPTSEALPGAAVDNSLTTLTAGVLQQFGRSDLSVDWFYRNREDRLSPGILDGQSHQIRTRLNVPITDRLAFLAQNETTVAGDVDPIYNDRTLLGLNWKVMQGVNFQVAQQWFHKGQFAGRQITSANLTGEYNLARNTVLRSRYTVFGGADNLAMQGAIGIQQGIKLSNKLKLDLAYERVFGDLLGKTAASTQFVQPFAFGQGASALGIPEGDSYSVGLNYNDGDRLQAATRLERLNSSAGGNTVITLLAKGKLSPAVTALVKFRQANAANQAIEGLQDTKTLKLGLAYRNPANDKLNALMRYEYRQNPGTVPDSILLGSGTGYNQHLFGVEAIYAPNWRWELFGKFALRTSTSYLANDLVGSSTVTLGQARATYRFAQAWDITGEARWLGQPSTGFHETGWAAELGYYVTPNLRTALGYSFGKAHDRDLGDRRVSGPYLNVSLKLNDLFRGFGQQDFAPPALATEAQKPEQPPVVPPVVAPVTPPESPKKDKAPVIVPPVVVPVTPPPPVNPTGEGVDPASMSKKKKPVQGLY